MIDLGAWASEAYRVHVADAPDPEDIDAGREQVPRERGTPS
jgi:endogenous inhibitor of DNA gyrase (YacG/DUF329 family)